jgi:hypothetical protein
MTERTRKCDFCFRFSKLSTNVAAAIFRHNDLFRVGGEAVIGRTEERDEKRRWNTYRSSGELILAIRWFGRFSNSTFRIKNAGKFI